LLVRVIPTPLLSPRAPDELRGGDQNGIFWRTVGEVREALKWRPAPEKGKAGNPAFPILLILSDINWRELDDFRRERIVNGVPTHEGHVARNGRHFPGAESGGARAVYLADEGVGVGLVSADGWRVPYSGSDSVVYHEGVGHPIGLPHPDPMDDSVMGTAQYRYWLNETWLNAAQKRALGLPGEATTVQNRRPNDLFSAFTALPDPLVPTPGQPVSLRFTWPAKANVKTLSVETQTDLFSPWKPHKTAGTFTSGVPPRAVSLGRFDAPTPVSYRVRVTLADGQITELWGYFQVRAATGPKVPNTP
jgi:hypothetical protein